jgi:hemolysin III
VADVDVSVPLHARPKPVLRGWFHLGAFVASIPAGILLIVFAPALQARIGATVYAVTLAAQFGVSALYHRGQWSPRAHAVMRRLDHSTIFLLIAGTYTPFCLFVLEGTMAWAILAVVWAGAAVGIATKLYRVDLHVFSGFLYIGLGWLAVVAMPTIVRQLAGWQEALLIAGGLVYTLGALVLATNRPNPFPRTFGYHEIWHLATIGAAACLYTVLLGSFVAA